ncbi:MAG: DNA cytosine methyltransferase [Minisyncoccia bacterium]
MYRVIDLFCGLGGWAKGFIKYGFEVHGYDIVDFSRYYPGIFHQVDLRYFNDFSYADVVLASPPCEEFSIASLPKSWVSVQRHGIPKIENALLLVKRAYEIIDMVKPYFWVIKNVRGAQKYLGKANFHIGSRYFWTNIPPLRVYADDIYGKTKIPPIKNRSFIRSMIPLTISDAFAKYIKENLDKINNE